MIFERKRRHCAAGSGKGKGGFTLVELIVVIAVLAILGGIAVPVYTAYMERANRAADNQLLVVVNKAFASACLTVDGKDLVEFPDDGLVITLDSGKRIATADKAGDPGTYQEAFFRFYDAGDAAFKFYGALRFLNGLFVGYEGTAYVDANGKNWYYDDGLVKIYNDSNFGDVGALMGTVDGLVTGVTNNTQSVNSLKSSLGFAAYLAAKGIDTTRNENVASALATYTAENLKDVDSEELYKTIVNAKDADGKWNYTKALNAISAQVFPDSSGQFANKAASAAILYSLATSFENSEKGWEAGESGDINWSNLDNSQVTTGDQFNSYMDQIVASDHFDKYLQEDGQKDVDALLGAFGVVNDNYDVIEDYRQSNGNYANADIVDTINGILGVD